MQKQPTRNTVVKKQARQEGVDSDYLFDNFLRFPRFRATTSADPNGLVGTHREKLFSLAFLTIRYPESGPIHICHRTMQQAFSGVGAMPRYLAVASFTRGGNKGPDQAGGTSSHVAFANLLKGLGGRLEVFYFAFGGNDSYLILTQRRIRRRLPSQWSWLHLGRLG